MFKNISKVLFLLLILTSCASKITMPPVVGDFDANRYLGKWYEIARYDHHFQKRLINVEAIYRRATDHTIEVINKGVDSRTGEIKEIRGIGYIDDNLEVGDFEVSFFMPFYPHYRILYLDENYQNAVIGGDSYDYLWILSREREITPNQLNIMLYEIDKLGYDSSKLIHNIQR